MPPKQEVDLKDATKDQWAKKYLTPVRNPRQSAYYKAECAKVQLSST